MANAVVILSTATLISTLKMTASVTSNREPKVLGVALPRMSATVQCVWKQTNEGFLAFRKDNESVTIQKKYCKIS
jgi:hypothetical protein